MAIARAIGFIIYFFVAITALWSWVMAKTSPPQRDDPDDMAILAMLTGFIWYGFVIAILIYYIGVFLDKLL